MNCMRKGGMRMPGRTIFQIVSFLAMESPIPFPSAFRCRMLRGAPGRGMKKNFLVKNKNLQVLETQFCLENISFTTNNLDWRGHFVSNCPQAIRMRGIWLVKDLSQNYSQALSLWIIWQAFPPIKKSIIL